ncbi:MAG: FAD-binding oxidoreductase [Deltaproteobacteria bacterium]|nr:FAD-binding oxidoreductase [Deltaproteobacteria bacterium]
MTGAAIAAWRQRLGDPRVVTDPARCARAARGTYEGSPVPIALLFPEDAEQARACVVIANTHSTPMHPVSRGCDWGLGGGAPWREGAAVLDLRGLDRITRFDDVLGVVTVEPGVTFEALAAFLRAEGGRWMLNVTGAPPRASVLANALRRGDGAGPYADRWQHLGALDVVTGDGRRLRTGFARFGDGPLASSHRAGVGPWLDGLFHQSDLGVVLAGVVHLAPRPAALRLVRASVPDPAGLPHLVDALRTLRLEGTLRGSAALWNDYRAVSAGARYPWAFTRGHTPLDRETLRAWWGRPLPPWSAASGLFAPTEAVADALEARVREVLGGVCALEVDDAREDPSPAGLFLRGEPHEESLRSVYWRARAPCPPRDLDPERDGCGVYWACAALPFTGEHALRAFTLAEEVTLARGFEPMLAAVSPTERALHLVALVLFERREPGAEARAKRCHDALLEALSARGYLPFRLGSASRDALPPSRDDADAVLASLRAALDPRGVLSVQPWT